MYVFIFYILLLVRIYWYLCLVYVYLKELEEMRLNLLDSKLKVKEVEFKRYE